MSDQSILTLMTAKCNAEEFEQKIAHSVFGQLPEKFTTEDIDKAKLALLAIYEEYEAQNKCKAKSFTHAHRCLRVIFDEARKKLVELEHKARLPRKTRQKQKDTSLSFISTKTTAEKIGEIVTEMENARTNTP